MPVVQISRIQHRRGKLTDLPQLAAGELGWVVDSQRLYIGNGTVAVSYTHLTLPTNREV